MIASLYHKIQVSPHVLKQSRGGCRGLNMLDKTRGDACASGLLGRRGREFAPEK